MTCRIIVVEDEPLIALDIEQAVVEAEGAVVGMAHTLRDALAMMDAVPCDGVVLDANLGGETAKPIVDRLRTKGVPYVVVSGYTRDQLGFVDNGAPLVGKPFSFAELTVSIRAHLMKPQA
ncbi:Transcriptional regulatory protein TcrA [Defluviimonas aquaemixtae]|uniref:Transcriptional regulatory protein TcrA n=1 Tax=Albidovulum aquaemixtae TaxID=1542388 RepID=A0A2R8BNL6_9RHOB|nr:response regulator [Defluviimonas aquaemixtae]SPH25040.1 Transcriptional regulatory protein TcrA [Defluviimonas aquaemixtae]